MKYKMICIDMDGTLLGKRKRISERNKNAIKQAHDKGIEIVVTTGRLYNNAAYFSKLLGVDSPVIAANGAIVIDQKNNEVIYECGIPKDECIKILKILIKYNSFFQFNTRNMIYCNNWITKTATKGYMTKQHFFEHLQVEYEIVKSQECWINIFNKEEVDKSIVFTPLKSTMIKIKDEINKLNSVDCFASGDHSLEINYKDVSKGNAIKSLLDKYNIKEEELVCIGDNENDISMIKLAGLGIAMGNAISEVKNIADYITDTNKRDGVAKAIEKFILK